MWASGRPAFSRTWTPSTCAARSASAARIAASPRVPISPCVRSTMPTRAFCAVLASVPPQVSSTSSRWAAMARRSTTSLITQRLHGIEFRGTLRRQHAKYQSDQYRHQTGDQGTPDRHTGVEVQDQLDDLSEDQADEDADEA